MCLQVIIRIKNYKLKKSINIEIFTYFITTYLHWWSSNRNIFHFKNKFDIIFILSSDLFVDPMVIASKSTTRTQVYSGRRHGLTRKLFYSISNYNKTLCVCLRCLKLLTSNYTYFFLNKRNVIL